MLSRTSRQVHLLVNVNFYIKMHGATFKITLYSSQILMRLEFSRQIFEKNTEI